MALGIGELLLREQRVTPAQVAHALQHHSDAGESLGGSLVRLGYIDDHDLTSLLSREYAVPSIDLPRFDVDPALLRLIPAETAHKHLALPIARSGATLTVALSDPTNVFAIDDIQFTTGQHVEPVLASETAMRDAVARYYPDSPARDTKPLPQQPDARAPGSRLTTAAALEIVSKALEDAAAGAEAVELVAETTQIDVDSLARLSTEAPVVRLVNVMLMSAIQRGASDIHLEPYETELRVRFRIDGVLTTVMTPPLRVREAITSRIKIMAQLDIAEKRLPQDGRMKIRFAAEGASQVVDFRVASLPTLFGEKLVLRLLDARALHLEMAALGLEPAALRALEAAVTRPWGMVLVTGPTGSGKTSTLYSAVTAINTPGTNIMTAEDPVEFNLAGINQVQVRDSIGLTFAAALRAFLRQDPDVILVGEIRDAETAEIAVKAALTGHLVLSTLHTNDAAGAVARLITMGVPPLLVATAVTLICAQRLVRRICTACVEDAPCSRHQLLEAGFEAADLPGLVPRRGAGCGRCHHTGYAGRTGLYQVLTMTDRLRELVLRGAPGSELERAAADAGMSTLRRAGLRQVREGVTTLDEVLRETVR